MSLAPGPHLGPYEIAVKIGEGGTGEVCRARDTRLGRDVAIKVLPAAAASEAGRLDRFKREARIVDALEEAHEKGIVHRDLRLANVELRPDGKVKVLDFGLAKAISDEPSGAGSNLSDSPTLTRQATEAGMILGTAASMWPEQARGKAVDRRADIFSLGVVLFEMLTGQPLFGGDTLSDTLASVLRQEIDWSALPPRTHY